MKISIDRSQMTPVYVQIKAQIAYQISLGILTSGQQLPTIRQLAADLEVAPLTVVQALNELAKEGLVEIRPGVGTFVVDLHPDVLARSRRTVVDEVVARCIDDAHRHGVSEREVAAALWERVFPGVEAGRLVRRAVFVGNYEDDTALLATMVADDLADYRLHVEPHTIQDLRQASEQMRAGLEEAEIVIAVPLRFVEVRRLVGDDKLVFGLPLTLNQTTREQLAQLPESASLGMVVTESEFMQSMRNVVAIYHQSSTSAPVASMEDEESVKDLLRRVDVVIYSMGIRGRIRPLIPQNVFSIELAHVPDPAALAELRELLSQIGAEHDGAAVARRAELQPVT